MAKEKVHEKCYFLCFCYRTEERQFWIGFNKRNALSGGTWQWSDKTPVTICLLCILVTFQVMCEHRLNQGKGF